MNPMEKFSYVRNYVNLDNPEEKERFIVKSELKQENT